MTKEEKAIYHKNYREKNKDTLKQKKKDYHIANKDKIHEHKKKYYKINAEKIKLKQKNYYKNNKNKVKNYIKTYNKAHSDAYRERILKSRFGITLDDYVKMFNEQKGKCHICKIHQSKLTKILHVDHNHATNKIRGLLCAHCNLAIGMFKDDKKLLSNAIKYLNKYK